jgi:hypothetical protein
VVYVFAGEEGGPEYVWQALKVLGAQRIDHGIHSLEDPTLVEYMATHSIPITLCPISNHKLQVRHTHGCQSVAITVCTVVSWLNSKCLILCNSADADCKFKSCDKISGQCDGCSLLASAACPCAVQR